MYPQYNAPSEAPHPDWYSHECDFHDRIAALYPRVDALKLFIRELQPADPAVPRPAFSSVQPGVNRDGAVCGLVNKAINTKAAIKLLCDAHHGDDAFVLARTILELAIILDWLLVGAGARLDTFCTFMAADRKLSLIHISEPTRPY